MLALIAVAALQPVDDPGPLTGDWRVVHEAQDMTIALDESSVSRSGDVIRLRLRQERSDEPEGRWSISVIDYDCAAHRATGLLMRLYRANGTLLEQLPEALVREIFSVGPGEDARRMLDAACHRTGWGEEGEE